MKRFLVLLVLVCAPLGAQTALNPTNYPDPTVDTNEILTWNATDATGVRWVGSTLQWDQSDNSWFFTDHGDCDAAGSVLQFDLTTHAYSCGTLVTADISDITATASEINTPLDGATVTLAEFQQLEAIGATTIIASQWAGLGGATVAGVALWDDPNAAAQLVTLGLTATASEINTPLDGASVALTEFQELETIGATTISANQWAALGGIAETLTAAELDLLDGLTTAPLQSVVEDTTPQLGGELDTNGQVVSSAADESHLTVQGHTTQTNVIFTVEQSDGTDVFTVANDGTTTIGTGGAAATFDAQGANSMDYGSADVTDHTFTADGATDADFVVPNNSIGSAEIGTIVMSVPINAGGAVADATQCAAPAQVTVNSVPMYTIICTDNDASTIYWDFALPDSYDGGTFVVKSHYIQTAADTNVLNGDVSAFCRDAAESGNTYGSEIAMDDAAVTGTNGEDEIVSAAVTGTGCSAGESRAYFRWQMDATGTTTAVATLHFTSFLVEYTSNVGD